MIGEIDRKQLMQNLFGFLSDEEDELNERLEPEPINRTESKGEAEVNCDSKQKGFLRDKIGSSRLPDDEGGKDLAVLSAEPFCDIFGNSDHDELGDYPVKDKIKKKSVCEKGKEIVADAGEVDELTDKHAKTKSKGKAVGPPLMLEALLHPSPADRDQMAIFQLSNLIGVDPKPFNPSTYAEEGYHMTDSSGLEKRVPSANIIRWREVTNPDGTTSVESNARFVKWSDGSLQVLIGNESFNVSERDAWDIQRHLFMRHNKGIYQSQGRISRKMKFIPSFLSSDSHRRWTALVDSKHKRAKKFRHSIPDVDPERMTEQLEKAEKEMIKANRVLANKKKKVNTKYTVKYWKEQQLSLLNYHAPQHSASVHLSDVDLAKEAAAKRHVMKVKMGLRNSSQSSSSKIKQTRGQETELSLSQQILDGILGGEDIDPCVDSDFESEVPKEKDKETGSKLKQVIDEDSSSPKRSSARRNAIVYDSSEE